MKWTCIECEFEYIADIDGDAEERMCYNCLDGVKDEFEEKEYKEDMSNWSIDHATGYYFCSDCKKYLSVAEEINDTMNNHDINIDFEYCVDSAYMLIDTYKSYKKIKEKK